MYVCKINPSHSLENTFQYVMGDIDQFSTEYGLVADKIDNLNWSLHSKVLFFIAQKDGVNYRYRFGIELGDASDKEHTVCIEQFFTSETFWNKAQITIYGTGVVLPYNHTTKFHYNVTGTEYYYTKTIIQLKKITAVSHFLYYTTHIDNVIASSPNNLQLYATVYGVDGYLSNIDSSVYNLTPYTIVGDNMRMLVDLDMNNKRIENLANPINNSDAANKIYCDNFDYDIIYRKTFPLFYNLSETKNFNFITTQSGVSINKVNPNLILGTNRGLNDYNSGLKLSPGAYIFTTKTYRQNTSFTMFISFQHDTTKTCEICWAGLLQNGLQKTYPRFRITNNQIIIDGGSRGTQTTNLSSRYQNKILPLWICFNGSNTYKMRVAGYAVTAPFQPPMNFQLNYLNIDFDVTVYKIGFIDQFIDINTLSYYQILFEEKRNGSLV